MVALIVHTYTVHVAISPNFKSVAVRVLLQPYLLNADILDDTY